METEQQDQEGVRTFRGVMYGVFFGSLIWVGIGSLITSTILFFTLM